MTNHNVPVTIAGAGPGDPELLTLKAYRRLQAADVVLHDALVPSATLELARPGAEIVFVGKRCDDGQDQTARQESINSLMIDYATKRLRCVRLKAGDPFVFGRGIEEVRALMRHGIAVEVIPGITAGLAAACLFNIPLTERNRMTSVLFCTGHTVSYTTEQFVAVMALLREGSPMVVYMGLKNLEAIVRRLIENGIARSMPVCAAARVSTPEQQLVCGTLETIGNLVRQERLVTPAVFVIGEHSLPVGYDDAFCCQTGDICDCGDQCESF